MTAPDRLATRPPGTTIRAATGRTALGALIGVVVVAGVGIAVGIGLMELYLDPNGGLENLGLLLFPIALGAVGTLVGAVVGVRTALRRAEDPLASRTAGLTIPVGLLGLVLVPRGGSGWPCWWPCRSWPARSRCGWRPGNATTPVVSHPRDGPAADAGRDRGRAVRRGGQPQGYTSASSPASTPATQCLARDLAASDDGDDRRRDAVDGGCVGRPPPHDPVVPDDLDAVDERGRPGERVLRGCGQVAAAEGGGRGDVGPGHLDRDRRVGDADAQHRVGGPAVVGDQADDAGRGVARPRQDVPDVRDGVRRVRGRGVGRPDRPARGQHGRRPPPPRPIASPRASPSPARWVVGRPAPRPGCERQV